MSKLDPDPWPKGCPACGKAKGHHEDCEHKPRFMAYGAPSGRFPLGYADEPEAGARQEPEMLDVSDWKRYILPRASQDAAKRLKVEEQAREQAKRLLSQEERIVEAQKEAASRRRDVSREAWLVERLISKGKADQAEKRLQALERIAYLGRAA